MNKNTGDEKSLCIRFPKHLWKSLRKYSIEHEKSMNLIINEFVERLIKREEEKKK